MTSAAPGEGSEDLTEFWQTLLGYSSVSKLILRVGPGFEILSLGRIEMECLCVGMNLALFHIPVESPFISVGGKVLGGDLNNLVIQGLLCMLVIHCHKNAV